MSTADEVVGYVAVGLNGDVVVGNGAIYLYWDGVVGFVAVDLYRGRNGREWVDRSLLGTVW